MSKTKREPRARAGKTDPATLGNDAAGRPIPVPGSNAVPAPNEATPDASPEEAAQTARVSAVAAAILAVLEGDAALELDLAARKAAGQVATWARVVGQVAEVANDATLGTLKHRGALVADVLDRVKAAGMTAGAGPLKSRTSQYAADLSKAARAMKADKPIPAELWNGSRDAWNRATFWAEAGAKSKKGRKPAGKTAQAGGKPADKPGAETVGSAAVKAVKGKAGAKLDALLSEVVAQLHGDFLNEFIDAARELGQAILARQAQAGTGTK
jgi:hypothetical protein